MIEQQSHREISDPAVLAAQPLVSVLMLAYRHEPFIAAAIQSVVDQRMNFPVELVIAEDCSPDGTLKIALEYQRRYPNLIRVLTDDRNVGMHANAQLHCNVRRRRLLVRSNQTGTPDGDFSC
jgi:glycosyltransferase involved in cell wall biosynthesis